MQDPVSILSIASVSPLGNNAESTWNSYVEAHHRFSKRELNGQPAWVAPLDAASAAECSELKASEVKYKALDNSVIFAMAAARRAVKAAGWKPGDSFGINIGSSRGATALFEKHHSDFLSAGKANTLASPTTTLSAMS